AGAQCDLSRAQMVRLKNGLQLLLVPDSTAVAVEVASWFAAPAAAGRAEPPGLARVLEGLASRGGAGRVASEGGSAGSFSTADLICFHETVPPAAPEAGLERAAARSKAVDLAPAESDASRGRA